MNSRVESFISMAGKLKDSLAVNEEELLEVKLKAVQHNPWFTIREIDRMLQAVLQDYLNADNIKQWLERYSFDLQSKKKTVGIVAAGNIPLASIHDFICALVCGMDIQIKLSSKDQFLSKYIFEKIYSLIPDTDSKVSFVDILSGMQLLITSGNNLTANHFKQYQHRFPCLIRAHRNSVAILSGNESADDLKALGQDVFSYYGLGCRNITKMYIPHLDYIQKIAEVFDQHFLYVKDNFKYSNNYDYQHALLSLNRAIFFQANSILFQKKESLQSAVAIVNFDVYTSLDNLQDSLEKQLDQIQCVCSNIKELKMDKLKLGKAQQPALWDYQDGVDVIQFLTQKIPGENY